MLGFKDAKNFTASNVSEWSPASVMVWISELLPGATTQSGGYFPTGNYSAQEKPLVSMSLLLLWNKVSFRSRASLPVRIWGAKNSLERPRTPRPEGAVVALCTLGLPLGVLPPPGTARGDAAVGSLTATFSASHLIAHEATAHAHCAHSPSSLLSLSLPFNKHQLSQMSDRCCFCSQPCNSEATPGAWLTPGNKARRKYREHRVIPQQGILPHAEA